MRTFDLLFTGSGRYVKTKAETLQQVANVLLNRALREEGFEKSTEGIVALLKSECEHMNDNQYDDRTDWTIEEITDMFADALVYNNAPHIINSATRKEIDNRDRKVVAQHIYSRLERNVALSKG
jgi:hypothetical protein